MMGAGNLAIVLGTCQAPCVCGLLDHRSVRSPQRPDLGEWQPGRDGVRHALCDWADRGPHQELPRNLRGPHTFWSALLLALTGWPQHPDLVEATADSGSVEGRSRGITTQESFNTLHQMLADQKSNRALPIAKSATPPPR